MDLRTKYLGLDLAHPLVASAGPVSKTLDGMKRLEDGGASAVVMFSLFEEQIHREAEATARLFEMGAESFAESLSYFPELKDLSIGPERYLELLRRARESLGVPVIASLNGTHLAGWVEHARLLEQAGASAIELNVYFIPTDLEISGADVEARYLEIFEAVKERVAVPVAVKLGPFFSAFGNMARRLDEAGADGLVLFNRFYQPDFDVEKREVQRTIELSSSRELRLPLLWVGLLRGRVKASLAATTGVETPVDAIKYLLAGADVVMATSSVLRHGPGHLGALRDGIADWMAAHEYSSVGELRGSMSHRRVRDPEAFERANYLEALASYGIR